MHINMKMAYIKCRYTVLDCADENVPCKFSINVMKDILFPEYRIMNNNMQMTYITYILYLPNSSLSVVVLALACVADFSWYICSSQFIKKLCTNRITSTETYNDIGTTVLSTIA